MTVVCGFCQRRGHNVVSCKRLEKVMQRIEKKIEEQLLSSFKIEVIMQTRTTVEKLKAEVEFLRNENERLASEQILIWQWIEKEVAV